ncbi:hypothetical protein GBF38_009651 [Nibea albiflora]|uniref:Uncharacterized protein n=1 Tax=Nibea albiflora TaxID=240163 RepID=A0ACB7F8M7_NIBAL|nr:hypothetical protein GBF38_009651 [Nibea albiflora]
MRRDQKTVCCAHRKHVGICEQAAPSSCKNLTAAVLPAQHRNQQTATKGQIFLSGLGRDKNRAKRVNVVQHARCSSTKNINDGCVPFKCAGELTYATSKPRNAVTYMLRSY